MGVRTVLPDLAHWKAQVKCQAGCPVATDAGRYVQLIADGRPEDAFLVARAPNPFASVCGRVCAAPCEDACRRGTIDAPVSIRALKRHVTEQFGVESIRPDTQAQLLTKGIEEGNRYPGHLPLPFHRTAPEAVPQGPRRRVAVIGAGPAGLSAAHDLALLNYDVTVFEASAEPGGMMRFGIPEYRLPRTLLRAEIDRIVSLGVDLKLNAPLSPGFGLAQLRAQGFESVFLSVGVSRGRDLQVPGVELDGVVKAIDYLLNVNRGFRLDLGRKVVVIGGGFVAFDAARTALRAGREGEPADHAETDARVKEALDSARAAIRGGATEVTVVSLEDFSEMPVLRTTQGHEEFEEAKREGVRFITRRGPMRFEGEGRLQRIGLRAVTSVFDANGRFAPQFVDDDVLEIDADACILAIGQKADLSFLTKADGVALTPAGTIQIDPGTLATSAPGIYAGGDVAFGPRNLIEAVANGKRAARSIHEFLAGQHARIDTHLEIEVLVTSRYRMVAGFERFDRETPPTLDVNRRTGITEVETGYDADAARIQAARCLVCHVQTIYDPERCVLCNRCVDICPEYCLAFVPLDAIDLPAEERAAVEERAAAGGPPTLAEFSRTSSGEVSPERPSAAKADFPLAALLKDDDRCIRCGLCAIRCPTEAMTMERFTISERWAGSAAS
ncbi:MAG: 4Fe-4S ferredoxin [Acidobacteria bacterium RIFCSPLOWO2_12_FULL_67_14b]|nr:MAG: 4Fe-4S ferredoxin [Acidobacteria bacterium RIFCSPLOWO2_12_FULL_67_14b]